MKRPLGSRFVLTPNPRSPLRGLALALFFWTSLSGCSSITHVSPYPPVLAPPMTVSVSAEPPTPGPIYRDARLRISLDDYPDPQTVFFGNVLLRSGRVNFDAELTVDLVGKAILLAPRARLQPAATYEVLVSADVAALDGRRVGSLTTAQVLVGSEIAPSTTAPASLTWEKDIGPTLSGCAPSCHSTVDADGQPRLPTRNLDLTGDVSDGKFGLIGVSALGESLTHHPLLRVAPGDSARSALLRKLIGGNRREDSKDPPYPEMQVDGRRMPRPLVDGDPAPDPLPDEFIAKVQRWIDEGAH